MPQVFHGWLQYLSLRKAILYLSSPKIKICSTYTRNVVLPLKGWQGNNEWSQLLCLNPMFENYRPTFSKPCTWSLFESIERSMKLTNICSNWNYMAWRYSHIHCFLETSMNGFTHGELWKWPHLHTIFTPKLTMWCLNKHKWTCSCANVKRVTFHI